MIDPSLRSLGLGSSEVAACVGEHPYLSEFDLWIRKTCPPPSTENPRMKWGRLLQRAIAEGYSETTGRAHEWVDETRVKQSPGQVPIVYSIDAVTKTFDRIIECKNISLDQRHRFGDSGSADVPPYMAIQVAWQMAGSDIYAADIAALFGGNDLRIFTVERDLEFEGHMIELASRWWRDHVEGNKAPTISDSETARKWLAQNWPQNNGQVRPATEDEIYYAQQYANDRSTLSLLESSKDSYGIRLKLALEDLDGIEWAGGKVTYKANKDEQVVDWEKVSDTLSDALYGFTNTSGAIFEAAVKACTSTRPGPRVLRVSLKGDTGDD